MKKNILIVVGVLLISLATLYVYAQVTTQVRVGLEQQYRLQWSLPLDQANCGFKIYVRGQAKITVSPLYAYKYRKTNDQTLNYSIDMAGQKNAGTYRHFIASYNDLGETRSVPFDIIFANITNQFKRVVVDIN